MFSRLMPVAKIRKSSSKGKVCGGMILTGLPKSFYGMKAPKFSSKRIYETAPFNLMKIEQSQSPYPPPARKLRDDPQFQGYYNAILGGLFASSFGSVDWHAFDQPGPHFDELLDRANNLVTVAYHGARYAHCMAYMAEHHGDDNEIEEFNASIEANGNGEA